MKKVLYSAIIIISLFIVTYLLYPEFFVYLKNIIFTMNESEKNSLIEKQYNLFKKKYKIPQKPFAASVKVYKNKRKLKLYINKNFVKTYKIVLGSSPDGHKKREGDGKTPEGDYYICTKNFRSNYFLFLGISYPNIADARNGVNEGVITDAEFSEIEAAYQDKKRVSWSTKLGGQIGIHGGGVAFDWTAGCIALTNDDVAELWKVLDLGDHVEIFP